MSDFERLFRTAARIAHTRYPGFVLGRPLAPDEIPVFTFHDVEAQGLTRDLEFLRDNGYRTLGLDEYLAARSAGRRPGRCVLLTFDDARASFWEVAWPLLKLFQARAVLFAPTYWISPPEPPAAESGAFMSWPQLRACADSGLVDVQAHAHRHALVPVAPRVIDFASPAALARFDLYDWPMRSVAGGEELGRPALGTPVYRAAPLLSARRRYVESEALTAACRELVAAEGGARFFAASDWRRRLHGLRRQLFLRAPGRFAGDAELDALLGSEFELCRQRFRDHLGYAPTAIAYPWRLGSRRSLELARGHGFAAAFGVALDFRAEYRRERLPLPAFGRLKSDWLQFLPGDGRRSLLAALKRKVAGLKEVHHLAH